VNDGDDSSSGLRSPAARALIAVTSVTALIIGGAYLAIDRMHASSTNAVEHPGPPATDAQTQTAVVEQARDIVAIAGLRQPTVGYLLVSCKNRDNPTHGVARIYGQCHNTGDHRGSKAGWTDVTERLH
jgi:hypothetical protein